MSPSSPSAFPAQAQPPSVGCSLSPTPPTTVALAGVEAAEPPGDDVDVLACPVLCGEGPDAPVVPGPGTAEALGRHHIDLSVLAEAERLRGRAGEILRAPVPLSESVMPPEAGGRSRRLLLVGTCKAGPGELRRAAAALGRTVRGRSHLATGLGAGQGPEHTRAVVEGLVLGGYQPPTAGTRGRGDSAPVPRADLLGEHDEAAVRAGAVHAAATVRARDLAAWPSNVKSPGWMVERAREVAEAQGLDLRVWDLAALRAGAFGGLLAVGSGSVHDPALVRLDYTPDHTRDHTQDPDDARPVVLVGKGITFDTGGLSIKPREAMIPMRTDMGGSAAVLAAVEACRAAGVRRRVVALLPLAENAVDGAAFRPSDVVTVHGGRTVEVTNTDAEGRLVLADALAYAVADLDPAVLVDVATLTGAATLGLGRRHAALYATDEPLAAALAAAAEASGERVWRMPLVEDYRETLDSDVADIRQVGSDPRLGAGSITAALFLREFTAGLPWAHLDIAGTARADKDEHETCKGATGWGARLLLRWLEAGAGHGAV